MTISDAERAVMVLYETGCAIAQQHGMAADYEACDQCAAYKANFLTEFRRYGEEQRAIGRDEGYELAGLGGSEFDSAGAPTP